ncbi:MAG TPA: hypothetical protein GXX51_06255 [Firmicutes bacterium]|nr:hypothetical protein [Bacillota bacterium]
MKVEDGHVRPVMLPGGRHKLRGNPEDEGYEEAPEFVDFQRYDPMKEYREHKIKAVEDPQKGALAAPYEIFLNLNLNDIAGVETFLAGTVRWG